MSAAASRDDMQIASLNLFARKSPRSLFSREYVSARAAFVLHCSIQPDSVKTDQNTEHVRRNEKETSSQRRRPRCRPPPPPSPIGGLSFIDIYLPSVSRTKKRRRNQSSCCGVWSVSDPLCSGVFPMCLIILVTNSNSGD